MAAVTSIVLGGACSGEDDRESRPSSTLRIAVAFEPLSLDPGLLPDVISANFALNMMDPLVKLNDELEPEAALAQSWEIRDEGKAVTFHLRQDGRWTNGDPVTAADYEYAWKRVLDPELASETAFQLYGIAGAREYNGCDPKRQDCAALRDRVQVNAVDKTTLEVRLTSSQPWFLAQSAAATFLPVHRKTVEQFGEKWTEPANIVTNGPYRLTAWRHGESLRLAKWGKWRNAATVKIGRIDARVIRDATTALLAFEAKEIDACLENACIPSDDVERLQAGDAYVRVPGLGTLYFGFNMKTVPDLNLRRALAFALDRRSVVENVTKRHEEPATSFTPKGMPGFETIAQDFLPQAADLAAARRYLAKVSSSRRKLNLVYTTGLHPAAGEIAVAVQAMWREIGIETTLRPMEAQRFLEQVGPPLHSSVDVWLVGWIGDYVDDINFLEVWTCPGRNSPGSYCDAAYDALIERARSTPDDAERHELYAQAEEKLTGPSGRLPVSPLFWSTFTTLRRSGIEGWEPNLLDQYDFTKVSISNG